MNYDWSARVNYLRNGRWFSMFSKKSKAHMGQLANMERSCLYLVDVGPRVTKREQRARSARHARGGKENRIIIIIIIIIINVPIHVQNLWLFRPAYAPVWLCRHFMNFSSEL